MKRDRQKVFTLPTMAQPRNRTRVVNMAADREEVIGNDIVLNESHGDSMRETEDFAKKLRTVRDCCNRLKMMIEWLKTHYPNYHSVGIIPLSEDQKADKGRYHKQEEDFIYDRINVKMIKAFMSANKMKPGTEKQYSFVHMRKYHNAIQHGASRAGQQLPQSYVIGMTKFLNSFQKENNQAKKQGRLQENEADPITFSFYRLICEMAIHTGDIYLWAYTVCQWNCMARSINIDGLSFGQFSLGMDSAIIEFFDSRTDQTGEKTVPKNCYANPEVRIKVEKTNNVT